MIYLLKSQVVENRRYTNINLKNDFVNVVEIFLGRIVQYGMLISKTICS